MKFQKQLDAITGSANDFALEHRIFNAAIVICLSSSLPGFFYMLIAGIIPLAILLFFTNIFYSYVYWLCRYNNQLQKGVFLFGIWQIINLNIFWLVDYGVRGATGPLLFVVVVMVVFTSEKPRNYLIIMFIDLVLLCTFDSYLQKYITFQIPYVESAQEVSLIFSFFYLTVLILLYKQLIRRRLDGTYYDVMAQLNNQSSTVNKSADTLAGTSQQLLDFAIQQKSATEQLAVTTEELGATAEQNQQLAATAMNTIKEVDRRIGHNKNNVDVLVNSINDIKHSSQEIQTINNVINDIAYQTNILSLNAMIEASRIEGSNGGFKVVAFEVKRLAERSANAAQSINKLLDTNFQKVQGSVHLAADMHERFKEIAEAIIPLVSAIQNVADASTEQSEAIRQITLGIDDIDNAVDKNTQLASQSSATANELRKNAESLLAVVAMLQTLVEDVKP